jgi:RNA polymerase sigma-70 factor (ECF subfamily)
VSAAGDRTATEESAVTSDLVERAQRGDHEAFDALAAAAYHRLYAIARRILRDGYAAEDAVQDALVKAWREVRGLRDPGAFDAWLHRLLVNACNDHARRTRRRPIELPALPIDRVEPRDDLAQLADRDELEQAFLELSVEHRAVLVLTHYVGLPAPEIARVLGVSPGTVASRLHYGARAMRAAIGRHHDAAQPATTPEPGR